MSQYEFLAPVYDELTPDVDYDGVLEFYEKIFSLYGAKPKLVLDLACGTGSLTWLMAEKGYEMIGVDASFEMLMAAREKAGEREVEVPPIFIEQSLEELDMYGTSDAAVCCLDGMNYIPGDKIPAVFEKLHYFVEDGGVFIFDINSPYKLKNLDGQIFLDETEDVYCVWRCEVNEAEEFCVYGMDIFSLLEDGTWERSGEEHIEYIHTTKYLISCLEKAGFEEIKVFGDKKLQTPEEKEERIFISAKNKR